jgi:hypothetical protein
MEKETAKIPGSLLARRWWHTDRSNQLVVRSKQPPDARLSLRTSTDGRRFFNVTIAIATALFILVEGAMFILPSNFPTAPETKPTAYPSATTLS